LLHAAQVAAQIATAFESRNSRATFARSVISALEGSFLWGLCFKHDPILMVINKWEKKQHQPNFRKGSDH
jgi:hypothetical protein